MARTALTLALLALWAAGTASADPAASDLSWGGLHWTASDGVALGDRTPGRVESAAANAGLSDDGALELRFTVEAGRKAGAEVVAGTEFGFGTFTFDLEGPMAQADSSQVLTVGLQGPGAEGENAILVHFTHWGSEILSGDDARLTVYPAAGFQNAGAIPSWESSLDAAFQDQKMRLVLDWSAYRVTVKLLNPKGKVLDSAVFDSTETFQDLPQIPLKPVLRLWNFGPPALHPLTLRLRDFRYQAAKR